MVSVFAEYVENKECEVEEYSEAWVAKHCRISQYMLQIIKCSDATCCSRMRSSWKSIFPDRFLPAPIPLHRTEKGPIIPERKDAKKSDLFVDLGTTLAMQKMVPGGGEKTVPFDNYYPSVAKYIEKRTCKGCGIYHASIASANRHKKGHGCHGTPQEVENEDGDEEDFELPTVTADIAENAVAPLLNIEEIIRNSPFIEDDDEDLME